MARNKFDVDETLEKDSEFNFAHLMRLKKYVAPYSKQFLTTIAVVLLSSVISMAPPYLMKIAIDTAIPEKNIISIVVIVLAYLAALLVNIAFIKYRTYTMSQVGNGIIRDMRLALFTHLQELPFSYYDSRPHGKILVRVVNYINSLSDLLSNGLIGLVSDLFSLMIIVTLMITLNIRLTLVSMAGLPLLLIVTYFIKLKQRTAWRLNSAKQSNLNAYIHESIAGMKITQGFVREDENIGIFDGVAESVKTTWIDACRVMFLMGPSAENISTWTASLLYVIGVSLMTGGSGVTVGVMVAFSGYIGRFWSPINNLANLYNRIVVNMSYLERIFETIDEPVHVKDSPDAGNMPGLRGKVEFEHVTFSYEPGRVILNDVSFKCEPGDCIALVGPTGAGKTSVINLISRFYDLDSGRILLDGTDIATVTLKSLRSQMGIMLQDSFIFSGTIYDNIRYSKLDATNEEVIEAAKAVCAHDFIMEMEDGYNTEVNERGSRLSVGQRQLISFARALLADPRILILDEATSSIDTKTEMALQKGLNRLLEGRTSFIIAHRLSTIKNATRIMYIERGKIVEEGNHGELMDRKMNYYDLYTAQYAFLESV